MASWGTVTLTIGEEDRLRAFARHHLAMGASEVRLYFDDPEAPHIDAIAAIEGVTAIRCDEAFWGGRRFEELEPDASLPLRQREIARRAFAETSLDWIVHLDDDELIVADRPVSRVLDRLEPNVGVLIARPLERLIPRRGGAGEDLFAGVYKRFPRTRREETALRAILGGPFAPAAHKGFVGHSAGKSFFRVGAPVLPDIHNSALPKGPGALRRRRVDVRLLHSAFESEEDVRRKVRRKLKRPKTDWPRPSGLQAAAEAWRETGRDDSGRLWRALLSPPAWKVRLLRRLGLVEDYARDAAGRYRRKAPR